MKTQASSDSFLFEEFRLDRLGGGLFRRDEQGAFVPVTIGSRALEILAALIERRGDIVSKEEIIAAVWPMTVVEENNLFVQISALRRILGATQSGQSCIQTVIRARLQICRADDTGRARFSANILVNFRQSRRWA
jgi:DNA-binding winged helix-turn-helix (wHTH) protein